MIQTWPVQCPGTEDHPENHFAWMSTANEFCGTMCKVRELDYFHLVCHSRISMSKRSVFGQCGQHCVSSLLRDTFDDLILAPNSKSTEKLAERRGERVAVTVFVC